MIRPIDANALIDAMYVAKVTSAYEAQDIINSAPTIEAVNVVRCKDCKFWGTQTMQFNNNLVIACCKQWMQYSRMNGYCHNGERKESE